MVEFYKKVGKIIDRDSRYKADAYEFVLRALWFTQEKLKRKGHCSGQELLLGIQEFSLLQYGNMSITVFEHWGVRTTEDFGRIVYNMIENGIMGKDEKDSLDDFKDVYDFREAFRIREDYRFSP
ncbi:MAG: hypothetical protein C4540_01675 [Candidatus Omnitrophota bacterium]|jgi:uncharacterized repeat protein (TIGR04138 family)|nr:MAG: hypothetical protein C4540_01675 [Candidatus Omnitrophota bacterium]